MTKKELDALFLLEEILIQVRGIASDAANMGHVSTLGRRHFDPLTACKAIYALTDAAHNLPGALQDPAAKGFLFDSAIKDVEAAGKAIFGDRSPLTGLVPIIDGKS